MSTLVEFIFFNEIENKRLQTTGELNWNTLFIHGTTLESLSSKEKTSAEAQHSHSHRGIHPIFLSLISLSLITLLAAGKGSRLPSSFYSSCRWTRASEALGRPAAFQQETSAGRPQKGPEGTHGAAAGHKEGMFCYAPAYPAPPAEEPRCFQPPVITPTTCAGLFVLLYFSVFF